jgi:hypothetical protein
MQYKKNQTKSNNTKQQQQNIINIINNNNYYYYYYYYYYNNNNNNNNKSDDKETNTLQVIDSHGHVLERHQRVVVEVLGQHVVVRREEHVASHLRQPCHHAEGNRITAQMSDTNKKTVTQNNNATQ